MTACDNEADGYGVHADGVNLAGDWFRVDDQNGSAPGCNKTSYMGYELVHRHRAVEERPAILQPDIKGDWAYDY